MKRTVWIAVLLIFIGCGLPVQAKEECDVCCALEEAGFPESYCRRLCTLKKEHPNWSFVPLLPGELAGNEKKERYTFPAVLEEETKVPERSLISPAGRYEAYWHEGKERFDSGFYRASTGAVSYFLDPRNFLTEKGIFQFLDLKGKKQYEKESVEQVFSATCLGQAIGAETVLELAERFGVDALHLAARLRQEQGSEGNCLLRGEAGSVLKEWYLCGIQWEKGVWIGTPKEGAEMEELEGLDGFYNPFNVSAYGDGCFSIFLSGAREAKKKGWNNKEKALVGGVEKIAVEYLDSYQNTLYLQKWNVDPRSVTATGESRNFWAQYMQNISGAKTEADTVYEVYRDTGLLEEPLVFLIPVYEKMPPEPCPDPSGGEVGEFSAGEVPVHSPIPEEKEEEAPIFSLPTPQPGTVLAKGERQNRILKTVVLLAAGALALTLLRILLLRFFSRLSKKNRHFWQK